MEALKAILNNPAYLVLSIVATVFGVATGFHWLAGFWPGLPRLKLRSALKEIDCRYCRGTGRVSVLPGVSDRCCLCHGKGIISTDRSGQPDCRYCRGTGRVQVYPGVFDRCSVCGGIGLQKP